MSLPTSAIVSLLIRAFPTQRSAPRKWQGKSPPLVSSRAPELERPSRRSTDALMMPGTSQSKQSGHAPTHSLSPTVQANLRRSTLPKETFAPRFTPRPTWLATDKGQSLTQFFDVSFITALLLLFMAMMRSECEQFKKSRTVMEGAKSDDSQRGKADKKRGETVRNVRKNLRETFVKKGFDTVWGRSFNAGSAVCVPFRVSGANQPATRLSALQSRS